MDSITINAWFGGAVLLLAAIVSAIMTLVGLRGTAKEKSVKSTQDSYTTLEANFTRANKRMTDEIARLSDMNVRLETLLEETRSECSRRIDRLQQQILILTGKLPDPDVPTKVIVTNEILPVTLAIPPGPLPVVIAGTDVIVPVALKEPIPLPMTQAQVAAAVAAAVEKAK